VKKRALGYDDNLARRGRIADRRDAYRSQRATVVVRTIGRWSLDQDDWAALLAAASTGLLSTAGRSMKSTINLNGSIHEDVLAIITDTIRSVSAKAREVSITPSSMLLEDLALDSLDLVAVILRVQDHFQVEIDPDEIPNMRRVGDLVTGLSDRLRSAA
jgi:acyl carrier protein